MSSFVQVLNQIRDGINSTSPDPDNRDIDDEVILDEHHVDFYHVMLFVIGILPIAVGIILPFWNVYKKRQQVQHNEDREWVKTKIADPVREKYLLDLMKEYSKVSDWIDTK